MILFFASLAVAIWPSMRNRTPVKRNYFVEKDLSSSFCGCPSPAGDGGWRVVVKTSKAAMRDGLARAVVQAGFALRELSARTLSLEDVFMHLTTEEPS